VSILVSDIVSRCAASLDAEGAEYFLFDRDYLPALLSAQDFIISVVNETLGKKKFSEEIFADITFARVFQSSFFSRVQLDPSLLGHDVWTILTIEPECETTPAFFVRAAANQNTLYRNDLTVTRSPFFAFRLNADEWSRNIKNPFVEGHELEAGESATSYSFTNYTNYNGSYNVPTPEIEIRPAVSRRPVCVRYAKVPAKPALITDSIEFPAFVFNIITQATLNFISTKQGDKTVLNQLSMQLMALLLKDV